ncbi:helix-turn-helix domain-containing protein [Oricola indica]|jgi:transcriptional regulator with XRE-family HTH domain|uniref:helix-turn-helix domain-containing protein n=1 Tax=Oricola indica TaxID=2872591 RepID=UPI003CCC0242
MITTEQIKAARALLHWDQSELAERAGVGGSTIKRIEARPGLIQGNVRTAYQIEECLKAAGIDFVDQDDRTGVTLKRQHE